MRRWAPLTLLALITTAAGCLLSPDQADRSALSLRVVARDGELAKSPCGDPVALLAREELHAIAKVYRAEKDDRDPLQELIASAELSIGPFQAATGSREMTGELDLPLGPPGMVWTIVVELFFDGHEAREALGEYVGTIRLGSGVVLNAGLVIDTDLGSGRYGGSVGVSFGNLVGGALVSPILYDAGRNEMTFGYVSDPIEWNDDPEDLRVIQVGFEGGFGPAMIYRAQETLPDLVPGPIPVQLPTIVLSPVAGGARLGLELNGRVDVEFQDGRAPREDGVVQLERLFTGCD